MGKTAFAIRHKLAVERIDFFAGCFFRGFGGSEIDLTRIFKVRHLLGQSGMLGAEVT